MGSMGKVRIQQVKTHINTDVVIMATCNHALS